LGTDGSASQALLAMGRFFTRWDETLDDRAVFRAGGRAGDVFYRDRWSHDKVVRSTHGVNCTGSCSWKVYVKDGIITWESQETDYPSVGPDSPEYEPRGCPRGAAFSWYTYSPTRVRYPYARGVLVEMYREAKQRLGDPVLAWADVTGDPERRRRYQQARGHGGLVRVSWTEAVEMVAAAHVNTIKTYGPDRCAGFSPIPAMSMVSHCVGTRFIQLIGGVMTSFYVVAFKPPPELLAGTAFVVLALFLGLGTGAVFAWVAKEAPPQRVGSVTGIVGAFGGLGGYFPPLVMGATYDAATHSYTVGLALLTVVAVVAMLYTIFGIRTHNANQA